jgi:hypothetical protein|tara:strand:+ start:2181 stop:2480 length:300 start_codon:yes stop_codon:yes gene_type:complete
MAKWSTTEWDGVKYDEEGDYANSKHDPVQKPAHYNQNGTMECIEAIEALITTMDQKYAYHAGAILKYLWRFEYKNGLEDLEKAEWYLQRLIKKYKEVHK